ncbi:hypothetical protein HA402_013746 [Bradysia odoriphaga]|nr:hypothetical protein HA402_013746 [Bradysia odoriphaga]
MQFYQILFVLISISSWGDSQTIRDDALFQRLGTYTFANVEKTYWVSHIIKAEWHLARPICKAHGFDIVTIDTLEEWQVLAQLCEARRELFGWFVHIGGVATSSRSMTNWYWVTNNKQISDQLPWQNGQPDFFDGNEWCLTLASAEGFKLNDLSCYGSWAERFICESVRDLNAEIDVKEGVIKVEEIEIVE